LGDFIDEAMIAKLETINLDQTLNDSNWLAIMKKELRVMLVARG
jgi:hypothetical protein